MTKDVAAYVENQLIDSYSKAKEDGLKLMLNALFPDAIEEGRR